MHVLYYFRKIMLISYCYFIIFVWYFIFFSNFASIYGNFILMFANYYLIFYLLSFLLIHIFGNIKGKYKIELNNNYRHNTKPTCAV